LRPLCTILVDGLGRDEDTAHMARKRKLGYIPVVFEGISFRSMADAARYFDLSAPALRHRMASGIPMNKPKRRGVFGVAPTPITLEGVEYESLRAAGRALGINEQTIRNRIECGNNPIEDALRVSVTLDGASYRSIADAARGTGYDYHRVTRFVRRGAHPTAPRIPNPGSSPVIAPDGREFATVNEAGLALGISRQRVEQKCEVRADGKRYMLPSGRNTESYVAMRLVSRQRARERAAKRAARRRTRKSS